MHFWKHFLRNFDNVHLTNIYESCYKALKRQNHESPTSVMMQWKFFAINIFKVTNIETWDYLSTCYYCRLYDFDPSSLVHWYYAVDNGWCHLLLLFNHCSPFTKLDTFTSFIFFVPNLPFSFSKWRISSVRDQIRRKLGIWSHYWRIP